MNELMLYLNPVLLVVLVFSSRSILREYFFARKTLRTILNCIEESADVPGAPAVRSAHGIASLLEEVDSAVSGLIAQRRSLQRMFDSQPWTTVSVDSNDRIISLIGGPRSFLNDALVQGSSLIETLNRFSRSSCDIDIAALDRGIEIEHQGSVLSLQRHTLPAGELIAATVTVIDVAQIRMRGGINANSLHAISHDLRTPQNSIVAMAELQSCDPEAFSRCGGIEYIARLARYTLALSSDLMLSAIDDTKQRSQFTAFNLTGVLHDVVMQMRSQSEKKCVPVSLDTTDMPWMGIMGMPILMTRMLQNLLDNAVKASPEGAPIAIKATVTVNEILVTIRDQAGGLPGLAGLQHIDDIATLKMPLRSCGYGLGIKIATRIAALHGAHLTALSIAGRGTTFALKIPYVERRLDASRLPVNKRFVSTECCDALTSTHLQ